MTDYPSQSSFMPQQRQEFYEESRDRLHRGALAAIESLVEMTGREYPDATRLAACAALFDLAMPKKDKAS